MHDIQQTAASQRTQTSAIRLAKVALLAACATCASAPGNDLGTLVVRAELREAAGAISGGLTVQTTDRAGFEATYAAVCGVNALLFRVGEDTPSWDQLTWFNSFPGGCKAPPISLRVTRDSTVAVRVPRFDALSVLGDSLPEGQYDVFIRLYFDEPLDSLLLLPAGRLDLRR